METIKLDQRYEAMLALVALATALLTFQTWRPGAAIAAAVLVGLVGLRRGLPVPLVVASTAAAGSALVHFAVAPEHFAEWGFGLFFVLCAEVQLGWALLLGRIRGNRMLAVGLVGSLFLVAVWTLSRTTGLPFGPEAGVPEEMGVPDLVSVVLELVTAAACAWALAARGRVAARSRLPLRVLGLALTVALTVWALAAVGAA
jgi:hypothetical protein